MGFFRVLFERGKRARTTPPEPAPDGVDPPGDSASVAGLVEGTTQAEAEFRMLWVSLMAAAIGLAGGFIAYLL